MMMMMMMTTTMMICNKINCTKVGANLFTWGSGFQGRSARKVLLNVVVVDGGIGDDPDF
jgi:hypothetical protein